ncbi:MAG: hypothetical protein KAS32_13390, partial [Candidatus Peribacteraceae bacterium]|nr:hypothetical protein [Candidatus Peribacteraceae bacterium]
TLTLDSPFDFAFPAGTQAIIATRKMDVNGSITSQAFDMRGLNFPLVIPVSFDITRIMIQMTTATAISFGAFGDIAGGLANGIVLRNRKASGDIRNIWNVKTNADFALLAYDYTTYSALTPPTIDGLAVRYTFAGQEKHGVTVRLDPGDSLQLLVQDDLSSLVSFRMLAQGHVVE